MEGFSVSLFKGCGDAVLLIEDFSKASPTTIDAVFFELATYDLHGLIGEDGDKYMPITAAFLTVIDGTHAEIVLETPKDGFEIVEHGVGAPNFFVSPVFVCSA